MDKPKPDMNTQLLLEIHEQMKWLKLLIQDMKMEVKCEIRGCKRALDMCRAGLFECQSQSPTTKKSDVIMKI